MTHRIYGNWEYLTIVFQFTDWITDITGSKLNLKTLNCVKSVRKRGVSGPHFIFVNLILSSEKMGQKKYYLYAIFT